MIKCSDFSFIPVRYIIVLGKPLWWFSFFSKQMPEIPVNLYFLNFMRVPSVSSFRNLCRKNGFSGQLVWHFDNLTKCKIVVCRRRLFYLVSKKSVIHLVVFFIISSYLCVTDKDTNNIMADINRLKVVLVEKKRTCRCEVRDLINKNEDYEDTKAIQ